MKLHLPAAARSPFGDIVTAVCSAGKPLQSMFGGAE